jgi:hypothetical protein
VSAIKADRTTSTEPLADADLVELARWLLS